VTAVRALSQLKSTESVNVLLTALGDTDLAVATDAALALVTIGRPAIEPLKTLILDERKRVRQAALETLKRIDRRWMESRSPRLKRPARSAGATAAAGTDSASARTVRG